MKWLIVYSVCMAATLTARSAELISLESPTAPSMVYADGGISYEVRKRLAKSFPSTETRLTAAGGGIRPLKLFRLKSIWGN